MNHTDHFELYRLCDGLIYQFDRKPRADGLPGYQRRDMDLWIIFKPEVGWVAWDVTTQSITGRPWNVLPKDQGGHPPAGEWVSKKGAKSYVYDLRYAAPPQQT